MFCKRKIELETINIYKQSFNLLVAIKGTFSIETDVRYNIQNTLYWNSEAKTNEILSTSISFFIKVNQRSFESIDYPKYTLTLLLSLNIVLPSLPQTLTRMYWSPASFNFIKRNFVKLSDILNCFPCNLHLLEKTLSRTFYPANFTIRGLGFFF